jgi:Type I phosphodiesterase / nucleotide pyrophosphatase
MATGPDDTRVREVDELRQQLRSLGYLDAGVDRFVLGSARHARRPSAIGWLASVRIGLIAAVLLGPAAAIGVAARVPGLITGPRDGFVVAAYLALLFGAGVLVLSFAVSLLVSWIAANRTSERSRRALAVGAGAAVTIASLAYLTLWWGASAFGTSSGISHLLTAGGVRTLLALALAAAISLLLGHAVTVAALAVTIARTGRAGDVRGVPGTSRRVMTMAGALTFCGAVLLFTFTARSDRASAEAPPLAVVSSGQRVRLIAIDGFDPDLARRLGERGRIPSITAALSGAHATLQLDDTRDPARAWTTIATGQPADVHAVHALETRRVVGVQGTFAPQDRPGVSRALSAATDLFRLTRPSLASGEERRVKTLWEVASAAGLRTATVNWWATWPAPAGSGIVLTDRAALRLERGGELDAEVAPAELYLSLRDRWPGLRTDASARATAFATAVDVDGLLRRSAELDALQLALAGEIAAANLDLLCTYLPGLDLVQHGLLTTGDGSALSPSAVAARLASLEEYYVFLDRLLSSALQPSTGEMVVLLTSPGRVQATAPGLLILRGPASNSNGEKPAGRPIDVAPTVLHALGVPISRELPGRVLVELFSADLVRRYPVRQVNTYGSPALKPSPRGAQPLDQEMIDRLRSLGYVR